MDLSTVEIFKKETPIKYYTMKFKSIVESFEEWKNILTELAGEGRFMIYRLWKIDEDPKLKEAYREYSDAVVLEDLDPENPNLTEKDEMSSIFFTAKDKSKYYFSRFDCHDNLVFFVQNNKIAQINIFTDKELKGMFYRRNK